MSLDQSLSKILIIDFGSQFTQLIARRIREMGVFSKIISHKQIKIKTEKTFGKNTRFDFYLESKNKKIFLEVKNVTLKRKNKTAEFPDSITSRGTKHLNELINATKKGIKSYLLFVIQREDCNKFEIAKDIDFEYSKTLIKAIKNKVNILCYDCKFSSKGIKLNQKVKFKI